MKNISILGSTGSIGRSTLEVIDSKRELFNVVGLSANSNIETLKEQILLFEPDIVGVADKEASNRLREWVSRAKSDEIKKKPVEILSGDEGSCEVASYDKADFVISAIVGASGLIPTLSAVMAGKDIGLANKETLVMAGDLIMEDVSRNNIRLLPVDSEHNALFQCLEYRNRSDIKRLILTASGGPFLGKTIEELDSVTAEEALNHPNWSMGDKITVDSATLMNKGLEVIEAHHLFGFPSDRIDVLIHPQSIVHSLIEFNDGGLLAQLSFPDMKGPIAYALSYPERIPNVLPRCSLEDIQTLTFYQPDTEKFPCLKYAYEALESGGTMPAILNAANEELVQLFLSGIIKFHHIPVIIKYIMKSHKNSKVYGLDTIFKDDRWARDMVKKIVEEGKK